MENILVATDLSECGSTAVLRAVQLSRLIPAKLSVIYVIDDLHGSKLIETISSMAEQEIITLLQKVLSPKQIEEVNIYLTSGQAYIEIVKLANKLNTMYTIIGMHRKHSFELFVGTTADRVSRYNMGVTLLSKNKDVQPYQRIVYASDFSSASQRALKAAIVLAPDAEFIATHFATIPSHSFLSTEAVIECWKPLEASGLMQLREEAVACFGKKSLPKMKFIVEDATPQTRILEIAVQEKADLIVLGKRNKGSFNVGAFNSVSQNILSNPPCDVLVARS